MTARQVQQALKQLGSKEKAKGSAWFFKTAPGQYGYGDKFRGVTVPQQRVVARAFCDLSLKECVTLLRSPWHEDRLTAVFILVYQFERGSAATRKKIATLYLRNTRYVNNWDIVDSSAPVIMAEQSLAVLKQLARSSMLWERRIAIVATFASIKTGNPVPALIIAKLLLKDKEDLIHKAVGWMLREVGSRCSREAEERFLRQYAATMPRTMLRYAIEKFTPRRRTFWMNYTV